MVGKKNIEEISWGEPITELEHPKAYFWLHERQAQRVLGKPLSIFGPRFLIL